MKAVEMKAYGGPEVLVPATRPDPVPTGDLVRVSVEARPVHPVEVATRSGQMAPMMPWLTLPTVPGWGFAGVLLDDAGTLRAGTRVAGFLPWITIGGSQGSYADIVLADPAWFAAIPDALPTPEASTLPMNGLTAEQALDNLKITADDTLLVTGASGAVGSLAAQLAARRGATVLAQASYGDEAFLADHTVIQRDADVVAAVRDILPGGVDAVLDAAMLGAPVLAAIHDNGRYHALVEAFAPAGERGIEIHTLWAQPDAPALSRLLHAGLTTRIAHRLPLEQAAEAHRLAERRGVRGAVLLVQT
ncbi:NADP-dependent oxidoreductase [Amycolatopsis sp. GM8]|uniref:NADP-dependent oxidoreductase n=1 Tax=Amycolatopsis sp. GM8 TaxID=2896530 RepID=UPI001F3E343E|nr:NADP-dependent oxidoreductase [Amycolatopsis sp. GM8]